MQIGIEEPEALDEDVLFEVDVAAAGAAAAAAASCCSCRCCTIVKIWIDSIKTWTSRQVSDGMAFYQRQICDCSMKESVVKTCWLSVLKTLGILKEDMSHGRRQGGLIRRMNGQSVEESFVILGEDWTSKV